MTTHKTITLDETERLVLSSIIADRRGVLALTLRRKQMSAHAATPRVQGEMRRIECENASLAGLLDRMSHPENNPFTFDGPWPVNAQYTAHQDAHSGFRPCVRDAAGETIATCLTLAIAQMIADALNR